MPSVVLRTTPKPGERLVFIDALKAIASQLIVLHHLAFYGPMSDYAQPVAPALVAWLAQYARIAVQVFLVVGGFLAAQTLARDGELVDKPLPSLLWRRYLKLVPPYAGALLLAIAGAAIARSLLDDDVIPGTPTLPQILAHLLLLQSVLGFDGLSAGVWYVAIDFQLFALLLVTLWCERWLRPYWPTAVPTTGRLLLLMLVVASLFHFNRNAALDDWAIYFFGAYGLGALTYWIARRQHPALRLAGVAALVIAALVVQFRARILIALCVALALGLAQGHGFMTRWPKSKLIAWFGRISYSVFLVHFPIFLVVNGLFVHFVPHRAALQFAGLLLAWGASVGGGALFYRLVESRAQRLLLRVGWA